MNNSDVFVEPPTIANAIRVTLDLARQNVIDIFDNPEENERQNLSINLVEELLEELQRTRRDHGRG